MMKFRRNRQKLMTSPLDFSPIVPAEVPFPGRNDSNTIHTLGTVIAGAVEGISGDGGERWLHTNTYPDLGLTARDARTAFHDTQQSLAATTLRLFGIYTTPESTAIMMGVEFYYRCLVGPHTSDEEARSAAQELIATLAKMDELQGK